MIPAALALALAGLMAIAVAALLLRRTGSAYRIARLLATAHDLPLSELVAAATPASNPGYVRTHGRISSDEQFPDEAQRPLVYQRRRLERADGRGGWQVLDEQRLAVPFGIEERGAFLAVDVDALGEGLIVIPREATGTAADLAPDLAAGLPEPLPSSTLVRLRIDQLSAVEHATVVGVVARSPAGTLHMTAGVGRPLILSSVEPDAAMRLLATGRRGSVVSAAALLVFGLGLLAAALVALLLGA
jgi:hypothetical protein